MPKVFKSKSFEKFRRYCCSTKVPNHALMQKLLRQRKLKNDFIISVINLKRHLPMLGILLNIAFMENFCFIIGKLIYFMFRTTK